MSEPRRFTNHDPIVPFLNHCDASEPIRFVNSWGMENRWLAQQVDSNGEPIGEPVNGLGWIVADMLKKIGEGWEAMRLSGVASCDNCGDEDGRPFTVLETQFHLCFSCTKMIAVSALRKTPDYEHQIKLTLQKQRAARNADGKQHAEP